MTGEIEPDTPLRLEEAIRIKFPTGNMTVSGLRKEARRGTLRVFKIANKQFTTLKAVEEMIEACREKPRESGSGSGRRITITRQSALSKTEASKHRRAAMQQALRELRGEKNA